MIDNNNMSWPESLTCHKIVKLFCGLDSLSVIGLMGKQRETSEHRSNSTGESI